jgi:hypothetical protein
MFQTNSATQQPPLSQMSLNFATSAEPPALKAPQVNPLDMFSNNKPATFATISGGSFPHNFDISNFGTMQSNQRGNA